MISSVIHFPLALLIVQQIYLEREFSQPSGARAFLNAALPANCAQFNNSDSITTFAAAWLTQPRLVNTTEDQLLSCRCSFIPGGQCPPSPEKAHLNAQPAI
jgi:hypothetical protein